MKRIISLVLLVCLVREFILAKRSSKWIYTVLALPLVAFGTDAAMTYELDGKWNLVADGTMAGIAVLAEESVSVTVDACSAKVYVN